MSDAPAWKRWLARWRRLWKAPLPAKRASAIPPPSPPAAVTDPGQAKQQRHTRREQLYAVVRETMIRAGVLSSAYKFKVLTLDADGHAHVVLLDVRREAIEPLPGGMQTLERQLRQLARERVHLEVRSLYWRWWDDSPPSPPPAGAHEAITPDEIEALRRALHHRSAPSASTPPDFEPTRPLPRRRHDDHPLGDTQMGDLR